MSYPLHNAHFIFMVLALLLFIFRGALMLKGRLPKALLSLAAVIAIFLFGTGVALVFLSSTMSFANSWVMTKVIGTLLFVTFSVTALKENRSKPTAIGLWLLAFIAFVYTFLVAKGLLEPMG
jgi:uncharacterized membrane protein SirB2